MVSKTNHQHLAQSALDIRNKISMDFDPVDRNYQICFECRFVKIYLRAAF